MEFILELLFEIILEGSLMIGTGDLDAETEKKIPMPIRILALLISVGIYGGLIVLFFMLGLDAMETKPAFGWLFVIVAVVFAVLVVYVIRKKWRER